MKKIILLLILSFVFAPIVVAQSMPTKLKRGTINLCTGWIELPKNIYDTSIEKNLTNGIIIGTMKGFGKAIVRTGCGIYEMITFIVPIPNNYESILNPKYIFNNNTKELRSIETVEINVHKKGEI